LKILIALSGGIDSAVAAAILKKEQKKLISIHLDLFKKNNSTDIKIARSVAARLKIPFYVLNFRKIFHQQIIQYFLKTYTKGQTPNPCVQCNFKIKFGHLLKTVQKFNCEKLATGHFVRLHDNQLCRGADKEKDQSYFLSQINPQNLSKIIFPLGKFKKTEVKKLAVKFGFSDLVEKKSSAGACFLSQENPADFLARNLPQKILKPGIIRDHQGKKIGQHHGLLLYTIGQRRGVELGGMSEPYFVLRKDFVKNELIVAPDRELWEKFLWVKNLNWFSKPKSGEKIFAQIRYRTKANPARIFFHQKNARVEFENSQRAITPGQAVAFFCGEQCLGGGVIDYKIYL
jgi:tRNA-uridine 2-sulfurtransferase